MHIFFDLPCFFLPSATLSFLGRTVYKDITSLNLIENPKSTSLAFNSQPKPLADLPFAEVEAAFKAFLATLEKKSPLSKQERQKIAGVFENLDSQVMQLHNLALESKNLKPTYELCRLWLTSSAAKRGMGRFAKPDSTPELPDSELDNTVRNLEALERKTEKELKEKTKSWLMFWKS
ncbi:MAG: hypothetical protein AB4290_05040 [Spirulina sp.]